MVILAIVILYSWQCELEFVAGKPAMAVAEAWPCSGIASSSSRDPQLSIQLSAHQDAYQASHHRRL